MASAVPQPLFHLAYQRIAAQIERGDLAAGDRLPSERWFGDALGVSRSTVRRAIEALVEQGLVEETAGGPRVARRGTAGDNRLLSLTELARVRGLLPSARVLATAIRPATFDEAEAFQIAPGADVFELRRLRLLDGLEVAIDHDRVPVRLLGDPMGIDFSSASLYGTLEERGVELAHARTQIEAAAVSPDDAALLGLAAGAPILVAVESAIDRCGRTVSLGRTLYRSDRHRFLATFTRHARRAP